MNKILNSHERRAGLFCFWNTFTDGAPLSLREPSGRRVSAVWQESDGPKLRSAIRFPLFTSVVLEPSFETAVI